MAVDLQAPLEMINEHRDGLCPGDVGCPHLKAVLPTLPACGVMQENRRLGGVTSRQLDGLPACEGQVAQGKLQLLYL